MKAHEFFKCNAAGTRLFSVNPDAPLADTLNQATCLLAAARAIVDGAATDTGNDAVLAIGYLIEMAEGVVDAAIVSLKTGVA